MSARRRRKKRPSGRRPEILGRDELFRAIQTPRLASDQVAIYQGMRVGSPKEGKSGTIRSGNWDGPT